MAKIVRRVPATIHLRVEPKTKLMLDRIARDDGRTINGLANKILSDWVRAQAPLTDKRAGVVS